MAGSSCAVASPASSWLATWKRSPLLTDRALALALVRRSQAACARLAALPFPTVAAIDGICLGGGTELALACSSRVAAQESHTQIGLPEVLLGIIPACGGTTRLCGLVGLSTALDLILTGRTLDARSAERAGLVERAVPGVWLVEHAHRRLAELAAPGRAAGRTAGAPPPTRRASAATAGGRGACARGSWTARRSGGA